jgi:uncharacterized protein YbaR (Trm112 family)
MLRERARCAATHGIETVIFRSENAMRKDLMEILACPMCKGELTLTIDKEENDEVVEGSLFCVKCNERYPIEDSIPNLLPPELRKQAAGG